MSQLQTLVERHKSNLQKCTEQFAAVLPPHLPVEKLQQTVINAVMLNPALQKADATSIMQSAMTAAVLGLEVDNVTGQGYIVPYKGKAQFIPGYRGYITLANNAGYKLQGFVVRENDKFSYSLGLKPTLEHMPAPGGPDQRGAILYAYATATGPDKSPLFKVLHVSEVNKIRDESSGYKAYVQGKIYKTPWADSYDAMATKTAIRALAPQLPLIVQRAAAVESAYERGEHAYIKSDDAVTIDGTMTEPTGERDQPDLTEQLGLEQ